MKKIVIHLLLLASMLGANEAALALNCQSDSSGNWGSNSRWSCGQVPTSSDTVTIRNGHTVTLNQDSANILSLTVTAGSTLQDSGTRTLNLAGNLTVDGTINFSASSIVLATNSVWGGASTGTAITASALNLNGKGLTFSSSAVNYTIALFGATPLSNHGSFNNNSANRLVTVRMSGANQSWEVYSTKYPQLQISGSGTKTYNASGLEVLGSLTIDFGTTFNATAATGTNYIGGDLTRYGTFNVPTSGGGGWVFNGTTAQTITGGVSFYKMTLNNSNGIVLSNGNLAIGSGSSGELKLTSGNVVTGSNKVTVSTPCNNNLISGTGWINGFLQLTFPGFSATCTFRVGDNSTAAPVVLNLPYSGGIGSLAGLTLTASTTGTEHPAIATSGLNSSKDINRFWTLGSADDTFGCVPIGGDQYNPGSYTATFQFAAADKDGSANASNFKVGRFSGGWDTPSASATTATSTTITVPAPSGGSASFGTFAIGEVSGTPSGSGPSNSCQILQPFADWRMDESSWNGTSTEVKDSSGYGRHGVAAYANGSGPTATTASSPPAAHTVGAESTCNYGLFDRTASPARTYTYVSLPSLSFTNAFTFTAWIRSTSVGTSGQRILVNDDAQNGWGFSLGDGSAGSLRLFNRNISNTGTVSGAGTNPSCGVFCLDTNSVISNNAWYFVAAAIDTTNKTVTLFVFNASGVLQAQTSTAFSGTWTNGTGATAIGGETSASSEGQQSDFHFKGNIDEVSIYPAALSQSSLETVLARVRTCPSTAVNHYELRLPSSSLACIPNQVTVAACSDNASPCTNYVSTIGGQTAVLGTSGGPTLGSATVTFNASGLASTTLSYPGAANNTSVTVSLSGETAAAQTARVCCVGSSCTVANSCSTTFNTAGFIVSDTAGGGVASIASQTAGENSATYYLRALKSNTSTQACEAALTGSNTVNLAYECNNPTTCDANNWMSILAGGASTTIARNDNGGHASMTPVSMTFDATGAAPFMVNYLDVGQVTLWANKPANATLLTALNGSSNAFVVAPKDFVFTSITASPIKAGSPFAANVTARNAAGNTTPSFGKEITPETVELKTVSAATASATNSQLVGPSGGVFGSITNGTKGLFARATCSTVTNGMVCANKLAWTEVGDVKLVAARRLSGGYLNSGLTPWGVSSARFIPSFFETSFDPLNIQGCGTFTYSGQPFRLTVTARSEANTELGSSIATTENYTGSYAKAVTLGSDSSGVCSPTTTNFTNMALAASSFINGVGKTPTVDNYSTAIRYTQPQSNPAPPPIAVTLCAKDADGVNSHSHTQAILAVRLGRLRLSNAFGSEKSILKMPVQTHYWSGISWLLNSDDSCTKLLATNFYKSSNITNTSDVTITGGQGFLNLSPTTGGVTGSVDLAANLGTAGDDNSCLAAHGGTAASLPWLRSQNGSCTPVSSTRDPSARATFGIYSPDTQRVFHVRELF